MGQSLLAFKIALEAAKKKYLHDIVNGMVNSINERRGQWKLIRVFVASP